MLSMNKPLRQPHVLPHQLTENVKLLHKVAILWKGHVLMLKRAETSKSRPGKWDLPGGNSEWPSDLTENLPNPHEDDVAREIIEETGLIVSPEVFDFSSLVHFETYFHAEKQVYTVLCGWAVELDEATAPTIQISEEHSEAVWVHADELEQYDPGFAHFIHQIAQAALAQAELTQTTSNRTA